MPRGFQRGQRFTEEHKKRLSEIAKKRTGNKNPAWKGNNCKYNALHMWVNRWKGKPIVCVKCGSIRFLEWANISGKYLRRLDDYFSLCKKCHTKYDYKPETGKKISLAKMGIPTWSKNPEETSRKLKLYCKKRHRDKFGVFIKES